MQLAMNSRASAFGPSLVLLGLLCQETGASIAVMLFGAIGPIGIVALRLGFSAIILMLVAHPRIIEHSRIDWLTAMGFGLVLSGMNIFFYLALTRLPLGMTVTIELLGPLTLSVVTAHRKINWLWAGLAAVGVALLGGTSAAFDLLGVAFALVAGCFWVGYILLSKATGQHFNGLQGLSVAMATGAVVAFPIALGTVGTALFEPHVLLAGLGIALLSSMAPYALEMTALRHTPPATFSILLALAPAVAAAAGFVFLGQGISQHDVIGIAAVVAASIGVVFTSGPGR